VFLPIFQLVFAQTVEEREQRCEIAKVNVRKRETKKERNKEREKQRKKEINKEIKNV
jgi:hypothetical protein